MVNCYMDDHELLAIHVCMYSLTHVLHLSLNHHFSSGDDQSYREYLHMEIMNDVPLRLQTLSQGFIFMILRDVSKTSSSNCAPTVMWHERIERHVKTWRSHKTWHSNPSERQASHQLTTAWITIFPRTLKVGIRTDLRQQFADNESRPQRNRELNKKQMTGHADSWQNQTFRSRSFGALSAKPASVSHWSEYVKGTNTWKGILSSTFLVTFSPSHRMGLCRPCSPQDCDEEIWVNGSVSVCLNWPENQ